MGQRDTARLQPAAALNTARRRRPLHRRTTEPIECCHVHQGMIGQQVHRGPVAAEDGPVKGGRLILHAKPRVGTGLIEKVAAGLQLAVLCTKHERTSPLLVCSVDHRPSLLDQPSRRVDSAVARGPHQS
eukprot:scaffold55865_cov61-Phaeocystis_antarctica.AAC.8